jgi:hypothetical protein
VILFFLESVQFPHADLNFVVPNEHCLLFCSVAGNVRFREIIAQNLDAYQAAEKRLGKPRIVDSIIREVQKNGGRFLKRDRHQQGWINLSREEIKDKVSHAIRDARMLGEKRNSTTTTATTTTAPNEHLSRTVTATLNVVNPEYNIAKGKDHLDGWMQKPSDTPLMSWQEPRQYHNPSTLAELIPKLSSNCALTGVLPIVKGESQLSTPANRLVQPPSLLVEVPLPPQHPPADLHASTATTTTTTTNLLIAQAAIPTIIPHEDIQTFFHDNGLSALSNGAIDHPTVFRDMHPAAKPLPYANENRRLDSNISMYRQNQYYKEETDSTLGEEHGELNCSCGSLDLVDVEGENQDQFPDTNTTNELGNTMMMMLESRKSISQWDMEFSMASLDLNSDTTTSALSKGSSPLPSMPTPENQNSQNSHDDLQFMAASVMLDSCRSMDLLSLDSGDMNHVASKFSMDHTKSLPM